MNFITLSLLLIGILYGGLTTLAGAIAVIQFKKRQVTLWASILMLLGGILTLFSVVYNSAPPNYTLYTLIAGLFLIHIAAINNGLKIHGRINPKHHLIRFFITMILIILKVVS